MLQIGGDDELRNATVVGGLDVDLVRLPELVWLPELARILGAKPPRRIPVWLGNLFAGDAVVSMMTRTRGSSNARAKRELGWSLRYPSWREGFRDGL